MMDPSTLTHAKLLAADLLTLTVHPTNPPTLARKTRRVTRAEAIGVVVSRDRTNKFLRFLVDDGSGCIPCILWLNHHLNPASLHHHGGQIGLDLAADAALEFAEKVSLGELIRVRGRLTVYRGTVQITVGDVVVERDANVEVLHWLECIKLARLCYDPKPV